MAELITLTANWTTGKVSSGMISRQYDNNRYCIKFTGIPDDGGENLIYYLLIYMKTEEGAAPVILAPVQLASDEWIISNYFTQIVQQVKFQLCVQNQAGTFEAHSPIFDGSIRDSLDHDGEDIDIDTSELFDYYRAYVEERVSELIVAAGDVQIDTSLSVSGAAAEAAAVGAALSSTNERLDGLGDGVPTEVRQALLTLFQSAAYAETGLTEEIAVIASWAAVVTAISINQSSISISGASTSQLVATTTPTGGAVTWASSDTSVATVSNNGLVTGVGNGTATITASCGGKTATCSVTVSGFATLTGITAVYSGGSVYDTATLNDLKSDLVVTGTYNDSTTVTITDYTLSGTLSVGTSTITVSYGGKTTTFNVTVSSTPLVPSDYTAYDYIAYVGENTNVNNANIVHTAAYNDLNALKVEFDWSPLLARTTATAILGGQSASGNTKNVSFYGRTDTKRVSAFSHGTAIGIDNNDGVVVGNAVSVSLDPGSASPSTLSVDDVSQTGEWTNQYTINAPIAYCGTYATYNTNVSMYHFAGIGILMLTDLSGNLVGKYIPVKRNSDNALGIYDTVEQVFHTSDSLALVTEGGESCVWEVGNWGA